MRRTISKDTATLLVGATVVAVAAFSPFLLGDQHLPWAAGRHQVITGRVSCRSGLDVEGVWIAEENGAGLWSTSEPIAAQPSMRAYRATIPKGNAYQLHVGCGGTPVTWWASISSAYTNSATLVLQCDDIPKDPAYKKCA